MTLADSDYWLTAWLMHRGIALVYLLAFCNAFNQFLPLLGEHGLLPAPQFLRTVTFWQTPSIFHARYSDLLLRGVSALGIALSLFALTGIADAGSVAASMATWFVLWALYLSIVNVGQIFYGFGWESLLLEAGFLAIFLGPSTVAPSVLVIFLFRWLAFRVEFGAGMIKMRGDACWRDLTCLYYHHETQPMPNPLSWYFHHLPRPLHKAEVAANHFVQLIAPWFLFAPQPLSGAAAALLIVTQLWLVLSGNFSWLNLITICAAVSGISGTFLHHLIPLTVPLTHTPQWFIDMTVAVTIAVAILSWRPARNMLSSHQMMNVSFNNWHLVNSYGAFGSVTRIRQEIVLEATDDPHPGTATTWREYEFKGKPGALGRFPGQFAPYHLRLDWLMWFAALSPSYSNRWFQQLLLHLLNGDPQTLKLIRRAPFENPAHIRAKLYIYRFSSREERHQSRQWWERDYVGTYSKPVSRHH